MRIDKSFAWVSDSYKVWNDEYENVFHNLIYVAKQQGFRIITNIL